MIAIKNIRLYKKLSEYINLNIGGLLFIDQYKVYS